MESINPATGEFLQDYQQPTTKHVEGIINVVHEEFAVWRGKSLPRKANQIRELAKILRYDRERLAKIMTMEMGKVITESYAEIEKTAWLCEFYADQGESMLKSQHVETGAFNSFVRYDPIGVVLLIMPWNFPFWQVIRAAIPALMAGNTVLLKHASNVQGCAKWLEWSFMQAGFPKNVFRNLAIPSSCMEDVIADKRVRGISFTGSEYAGKIVASLAGKYMKKCVMELGGSDPFVVLSDANMDLTCKEAVKARLSNVGQTCIAAKRFIVDKSVIADFESRMKTLFEEVKISYSPSDKDAVYGPMARADLRDEIQRQVDESVKMGARLVCGGKSVEGDGFFYEPTILADVKPGMPAYDEETFGPLMAIISVDNDEEAIAMANNTRFGLGASVWTADLKKGSRIAGKIEAGMVFINSIVRSDPRMPFGGVKDSGYGRECAKFGIREFVNVKSVWID